MNRDIRDVLNNLSEGRMATGDEEQNMKNVVEEWAQAMTKKMQYGIEYSRYDKVNGNYEWSISCSDFFTSRAGVQDDDHPEFTGAEEFEKLTKRTMPRIFEMYCNKDLEDYRVYYRAGEKAWIYIRFVEDSTLGRGWTEIKF